MKEFFINDVVEPYVLEVDSTLDLAPVQLQPPSIVINRTKGLVYAQTGKTKRTFADVQKLLDDATAGRKENPLRISEASVAGKHSHPDSPPGLQADAKRAKSGPATHFSSLQSELLEVLRVFHSAESLHFVASDTSFSKLRAAPGTNGWQVDLTGVVPECPQHLEMPRPVHFQWDEHESTHMSEAVDWLNQHLCPIGVFALRAESCSWLKAAFGSIHLNLHKTTVVFLLEEAKSEYNLDSLSENLMLMMLPFIVGLYELKTTKNLEQCLSRNQAHGMVECLALNSMLTSQARHVRVYMGDLNTTYSFASRKSKLFMTSQGVGIHRIVAAVDWMKSRLTEDAEVARGSLSTNRLPDNMHTDCPSADSSSGNPQEGTADRSSHPCPLTAAPSEPDNQQGLASTVGSGSDAVVGDQASEARFAADLRTLARTPAFYELLGLQEPPHPFLEDFANRKVYL